MIKKVSYTFINIILIILFLEISLQVIYRIISGNYLLNRTNIPIYENSDICCWKLKKNLSLSHETNEFDYNIYTNNQSHRITNNSSKIFTKKSGKTLLFMGPSFGFGWGVDYNKSYAYQIGNFYKKNNFQNVINASVPGHLPSIQLCWYLKQGYKYDPDIIVHTLTSKLQLYLPREINMDKLSFCDDICGDHVVTNDGYLTTDNNSFLKNPKWFLKNSALIFYSWYMLSKIQSYFIDDNRVVKSAVGVETHDLKNYDDENYLQNFQNYIDLVKKVSPNTKVIFLYIPDSYNVHIKDRARWSHQNIDFEKSLEDIQKILTYYLKSII